MRHIVIALAAAALVMSAAANARNTPCSGKKWGVSHCSGGKPFAATAA